MSSARTTSMGYVCGTYSSPRGCIIESKVRDKISLFTKMARSDIIVFTSLVENVFVKNLRNFYEFPRNVIRTWAVNCQKLNSEIFDFSSYSFR